ncbi:hypothetical protein [Bradyrhizobium elkanii]|uniref:hypothetical protein n=1 Tax=Bradyrhizobium elkanii TaxID=29448 RepID=UPI00384E8858
MKKILLGLIAVAVLAAGSYFGFDFYAQRRVTRDVEAAFEQVRATGAKASHGKITFDVKSRTLTIADVATESGTQSPVSVKIANLTMTGLGQTDAARVSAGNVEFSDVEIGVAGPTRDDHLTDLQGAADHGEGLFRPHQLTPASGGVVDLGAVPVRIWTAREHQRIVGRCAQPDRNDDLQRRRKSRRRRRRRIRLFGHRH